MQISSVIDTLPSNSRNEYLRKRMDSLQATKMPRHNPQRGKPIEREVVESGSRRFTRMNMPHTLRVSGVLLIPALLIELLTLL